MIKKRNFVKYGADGSMEKLFCKVCGKQIAGMVLRPKGSGPNINVMVAKFLRNADYTEIKIQFNDGSSHVTHGCKECLTNALTTQQMLTLYKCDMEEMGMFSGLRKPVRITEIDHTAQGIL